MKGVILRIAPDARIVDLTHTIAPQNVQEAAILLDRAAPYFPEGTIHLVLVDPGAETPRRPIAALIGTQRFLGPDNGFLTLLLRRAQRAGWPTEILHLDQPRFWRQDLNRVFHGRDVFAPVAAHLAAGTFFTAVGSPITDPVLLPLTGPTKTATGLKGEIRHIDRFGNLATNIDADDLAALGEVRVSAGGAETRGLVKTFGERPPGELIARVSSHGELMLAVVNGNAAEKLKAKVGDPVEVLRA
jgi:hypothetical protein